jgi:hypothetical protein
VTDADDMEHWWNNGWGKTELLRGTAVPVPFFQNLSTWTGLVIKPRSVDGDQSPEPYATQDCAISADMKQIDKTLTIAKMVKI